MDKESKEGGGVEDEDDEDDEDDVATGDCEEGCEEGREDAPGTVLLLLRTLLWVLSEWVLVLVLVLVLLASLVGVLFLPF